VRTSSDFVVGVWVDIADLTGRFYAAPNGLLAGEGWFASMSWLPTTELNVCGLAPTADARSGAELAAALGREQPALVFTSKAASDPSRQALIDVGFDVTPVLEPVMCSQTRPQPRGGPFQVRRCTTAEDVDIALDLTAAAHQVPRHLLASSIGAVASAGRASVWLAHEGDQPVSTVWLTRAGACLGAMEMMTPPEYQGRGAGRALLSQALHSEWDETVDRAVLLGTPAGRRLYETLGFVAVDESLSCVRGLDDAVRDAIGQPRAPDPS
jgi:GNAT superfamily N-acetyltransferase